MGRPKKKESELEIVTLGFSCGMQIVLDMPLKRATVLERQLNGRDYKVGTTSIRKLHSIIQEILKEKREHHDNT